MDISIAKGTELSAGFNMTVAAAAKDQFHWRGSSIDLYEVVCGSCLSIQRLKYQFEASVIERRAGRFLHLNNSFPKSLLRQLQRAMMAIRIVACLAE